jgi:transcriptional regulator with XRE-family HTH domain
MASATNSLEVDRAARYSQQVSFGRNLRRLRSQRQVAAKTVAAALGIKQGTYSDYERDRRGLPEGPTLLRFAKYFCVSLDDLIVGIDAEYDALTRELRAESTHVWAVPSQRDAATEEIEKIDRGMTQSVTPPGVKDRGAQSDQREETTDGTATVRDRRQKFDPDPAVAAIEIERNKQAMQRRAHALILSLYGYADGIRSVADDLLTPPRPPAARAPGTADHRSDPSVRARSARDRRR